MESSSCTGNKPSLLPEKIIRSVRDLAVLMSIFLWKQQLRKNNLRWAAPPMRNDAGKVYCEDVEVRGTHDKGLGLFARRSLSPGLMFGYGGQVIDEAAQTLRSKTFGWSHYILEGPKQEFVDAHPRLSKEWADFWIGSKANEPGPGQTFNCVYMHDISITLGRWTEELVPLGLVICVICPIKAGEELVSLYEWHDRRYANLGYYPNYTLPKLPKKLRDQFDKFVRNETPAVIPSKARQFSAEPVLGKRRRGRPPKNEVPKRPRGPFGFYTVGTVCFLTYVSLSYFYIYMFYVFQGSSTTEE